MPESVLSLGREVGGQVFPFGTGTSLFLKAPDPLMTYLGFVIHQLNMYSYLRQKSERNNIGSFVLHGSDSSDLRPTKYDEQYVQ